MSEATFTFRVDEDLKSAFTDAAKAHDRTAAQLMRDFMRDYVRQQPEKASYDAWLKSQVQAALEDPRPNVAHEDVMTLMQAEIKRHAAGVKRGG